MEYDIMRMRKSGIKIGENCKIYTYIQSNEPFLISIGNNVTICSAVKFCTHDNGIIKVIPGKTDVVGEISVGDDCFIGMNAMLLLGVSLGKRCIVGAGSVVTHSFPDNCVLVGNPARMICTTEKYARKYANYALDFSNVQLSERALFLDEKKDKLVKRQ